MRVSNLNGDKTFSTSLTKVYYYTQILQILIKNIGKHKRTCVILNEISKELPKEIPLLSQRQMQRILTSMKDIGLVDNHHFRGWYITESGLKGFGFDKYGDML